MKITELIGDSSSTTAFSFEVLPPKKGTGIDELERTVEDLLPFAPKYINITNHHSDPVWTTLPDGRREMRMERKRPGSVAVAAALQYKYGVTVVPHILCAGYTRAETEYVMLDLQFLGISNILLLGGDRRPDHDAYRLEPDGYRHTTDLIEAVNRFNDGFFESGERIANPGPRFNYGVACYPEVHPTATSAADDAKWFRRKVEQGAEYGVTQMFFDNKRYFDFVRHMREEGVTVPIIPGIKPLINKRQLDVLPEIFKCSIPEDFRKAMMAADTADAQFEVGIEWCVAQCRELMKAGVPSIHFYTNGYSRSVKAVAKQIY